MLYTRKGDDGTSGLFGTKERFPKNSPLYEALGDVDELNSFIGLCRTKAGSLRAFDVSAELLTVQQCLFIIQAELAGADKRMSQAHIDVLEAVVARAEEPIGNPHSFIVPGTTEASALLDVARVVCRRAERSVIAARTQKEISKSAYAYLNRLSSLLYALARLAAFESDTPEEKPTY